MNSFLWQMYKLIKLNVVNLFIIENWIKWYTHTHTHEIWNAECISIFVWTHKLKAFLTVNRNETFSLIYWLLNLTWQTEKKYNETICTWIMKIDNANRKKINKYEIEPYSRLAMKSIYQVTILIDSRHISIYESCFIWWSYSISFQFR